MGVAGDTDMKCRGTRHVYSSHEIAFLSKNEITVQMPPTKEGVSKLLRINLPSLSFLLSCKL